MKKHARATLTRARETGRGTESTGNLGKEARATIGRIVLLNNGAKPSEFAQSNDSCNSDAVADNRSPQLHAPCATTSGSKSRFPVQFTKRFNDSCGLSPYSLSSRAKSRREEAHARLHYGLFWPRISRQGAEHSKYTGHITTHRVLLDFGDCFPERRRTVRLV